MPAYNYFPVTYPGYNYYQPFPQPIQQPVVQQAPQQQQSQSPGQIQNGGFITVRSEADARNYPVAPGTSVTFKHETAPYCYTKTMGFSQLEAPKFEKFRLVKEDDAPETASGEEYATKEELGRVVGIVQSVNDIIGSIKNDVESMKGDLYGAVGKRKAVKKVEEENDS